MTIVGVGCRGGILFYPCAFFCPSYQKFEKSESESYSSDTPEDNHSPAPQIRQFAQMLQTGKMCMCLLERKTFDKITAVSYFEILNVLADVGWQACTINRAPPLPTKHF